VIECDSIIYVSFSWWVFYNKNDGVMQMQKAFFCLTYNYVFPIFNLNKSEFLSKKIINVSATNSLEEGFE